MSLIVYDYVFWTRLLRSFPKQTIHSLTRSSEERTSERTLYENPEEVESIVGSVQVYFQPRFLSLFNSNGYFCHKSVVSAGRGM